jgi:hypothetical protein
MKRRYEQYRNTIEWQVIEKSISDLVNNRDLELKTNQDYLTGYITEKLIVHKSKVDLRIEVLLSASRALLGAVTKHLRGVTVAYNNDLLIFRAYFDKGASSDEIESLDIALTEIIADMGQEIKQFQYEPINLFYPEEMEVLNDWIYLREEK